MPQIELPFVLDILHHRQKWNETKRRKEPHYFSPFLTASHENVVFTIKSAEVVRGDLKFTAPNGDFYFMANQRCQALKDAIMLAIYNGLMKPQPSNF